ncbi:hypothetical protein [Nocardioides speluncae]|uniref:hypothetical protein n=1 Tax=Nocardioides speluncae TaxID=2670337 RepID=UPI000D6957C7|nr:hypothetical protein [Nocardioides speluncae]
MVTSDEQSRLAQTDGKFDAPGGPCAVECVVSGDGFGVPFGVRRHEGLLTVHHPGGRVVVVDLVTRELVADVRTAV